MSRFLRVVLVVGLVVMEGWSFLVLRWMRVSGVLSLCEVLVVKWVIWVKDVLRWLNI